MSCGQVVWVCFLKPPPSLSQVDDVRGGGGDSGGALGVAVRQGGHARAERAARPGCQCHLRRQLKNKQALPLDPLPLRLQVPTTSKVFALARQKDARPVRSFRPSCMKRPYPAYEASFNAAWKRGTSSCLREGQLNRPKMLTAFPLLSAHAFLQPNSLSHLHPGAAQSGRCDPA